MDATSNTAQTASSSARSATTTTYSADKFPGGSFTFMATPDNIVGAKGESVGDPKGPEGNAEATEHNPEIERLKRALEKANKEAGDYRKQLQARMTQEELARQEAEQKHNELQEKYNELLRSSTIANHMAKYLTMPGYDEKLAMSTAEALFDGDVDKVLANQQKANEAYAKQLKADAMKNMTPPAGGSGEEQPESDAIRLAKELGQKKAQAAKTSDDIMKQFMRGGRLS